ncbi:A-kinase anchor protein 3 [Candoia aspera]|uniref:A-kinase anchor protein 3 n=1 Tax=Candoia aspera TaxID=51853 RepID=UPI002FD80432
MTENIDWLQSQSGLCKIERDTPSEEEEEEEKTQQNWTQSSSDPLKLRKELEKCTAGVQNALNASNNARRARPREAPVGRQAVAQRNLRSPGGYSVCDEEFSLNVSSNRGSHLAMKAGCQKESKDEESDGSASPNPNPDPDEVSFYCNRLSNLAIAMARKEMNDRPEGNNNACIHNTLFAAAGDHGLRSIGVGTEDGKHISSRMCECKYEESPSSKKKASFYYKEENTEIPNKSEPSRDEGKGCHHRKRFGPDEYSNSLSKGILVYANNVVSDMMVSVMKTMKVKVNDSNIACAVLKKVLLKHSKEVVSDLIDSCMKNLHDVTGTLMTDSDFVSAVKRSLFTQGSQKASEIVQAMLNRLHNALIVQKQVSERNKSHSMAFATIKTGQGLDAKTQNMRFSAAKTETMKDKETTCAETVGNHIIKEGLSMWHQKQQHDNAGSASPPARAFPAQDSQDLSNLSTDSWARDLIVTALLLIQYHLVQQENAMKDASEGGRASKAAGPLGYLAQDKGISPLKQPDTLRQSEDEQFEMNAENDMSSIVVMLIQKLINETVKKLGGNSGTLMADEAYRSAYKGPEGPGPSGLSEIDHSYEDAISGLTKMILDQCDVNRKEGGSGPFIDNLVDTVTKLCLMIAKYSNPESGLGDGDDVGGPFYSKGTENAESRTGSGEDAASGRKVVVTNQNAPENIHSKQLQAVLQWVAASQLNVPVLYFMDDDEETQNKLQQLSTVAVERNYSVGEVMQAVLKYEKERQLGEALGNFMRLPVLDWLLQNL